MKTQSAIVGMLCCVNLSLAVVLPAMADGCMPGYSPSPTPSSARLLPDFAQPKFKVILFLDPECPVSNAYMREIKNIHADYAKRGIAFEAVFPVQTVKRSDIKAFLTKYQTTIPGYQDPDLQKVKRYHATTMPEAILINADGEIMYRGAIDNWYYALGKNRAKATEPYLRNALEAALNGEVIIQSRTEAIGCIINQ